MRTSSLWLLECYYYFGVIRLNKRKQYVETDISEKFVCSQLLQVLLPMFLIFNVTKCKQSIEILFIRTHLTQRETNLHFKLQQLWYKLFPALVLVLGNLNLNLGNVRAGRILHSRFLRNILASPMSFFDMTPMGRILNRFGKDIDVVDTIMAQQIHAWLYCVLRVISVPVVIVYSTPLFLSVIIPLFVPYFVVQVSVALYCVYLVI